MLPKYRRVVEELFQHKLLAVCVCTETLAAGINLPARSVVLTSLVKGPRGKERLIDSSTAHQIFGRAGRPQFDDKGFVYAIAHEDDVRLLRWKEKYDSIPENTKDPGLLKAKKALKKKKPIRSEKTVFWTEPQFEQLKGAPPGKLYSKGPLPWRLLAYLLKTSPEISRVRKVLRKRLMDEARMRSSENNLDRMLLTLAEHGYVILDPPPPARVTSDEGRVTSEDRDSSSLVTRPSSLVTPGLPDDYEVLHAQPTEKLDRLLVFRSIHPLYGGYLLDHLGIANRDERIQAFESVLEIPRPLLRYVRVPFPDRLPPGPLATTRLDPELIQRGMMAAPLPPSEEEEEEDEEGEWERPLVLGDKLRLLFDALYPTVTDVETLPVWAAGELLSYGGNFNLYVKARDLIKQEGIIFRHLLRLILLCGEFAQVCPADTTPAEWQADLRDLADQWTASCRAVDPTSTDMMIEMARANADVVEGEKAGEPVPPPPPEEGASLQPQGEEPERVFGAGIFEE